MKAKTVNFERGKEPMDSMKVGVGSKKYIPQMEKILSDLGFKFKSWKADDYNTHIRWDIHSPIGEGNYYEIAWIGEGSTKSGEYGYYLTASKGKFDKFPEKGFEPTPFRVINHMIGIEMTGFDEKLQEKKVEHYILEEEIKRMEDFEKKVNSYES